MATHHKSGDTRPRDNSLWADAWRRLTRDPLAVGCMAVLAAVVFFAFITPLLPLQPPDAGVTNLSLAAPNTVAAPRAALERFVADLTTSRERYRQLAANRVTDPDLVAEQRERLRDVLYLPYRQAGFPDVGPLGRAMIGVRTWAFGSWSLPSLAGRDKLGHDVLSRIFWGARVSLIVGIVATLVSLVIGVTYGAVSGYLGGRIDNLMMRLVDVLYSVPFIYVVIFLLTLLGEEQTKKAIAAYGIDRITIFYVVVGAIYWLTMARVVRGQVLSIKNELYVEAARSQGVSQSRIIFRHVIPNVLSVVIVYLTLTIPRVMLFEAFLSYLGLGVQAPDVSWGLLAKEGMDVITPIRTYWWLVLYPSLAISVTLFALNFLGDAVRDALDPKLRTN